MRKFRPNESIERWHNLRMHIRTEKNTFSNGSQTHFAVETGPNKSSRWFIICTNVMWSISIFCVCVSFAFRPSHRPSIHAHAFTVYPAAAGTSICSVCVCVLAHQKSVRFPSLENHAFSHPFRTRERSISAYRGRFHCTFYCAAAEKKTSFRFLTIWKAVEKKIHLENDRMSRPARLGEAKGSDFSIRKTHSAPNAIENEYTYREKKTLSRRTYTFAIAVRAFPIPK